MLQSLFTYVTGMVGLVSFILQIKPFSPKYQETIRAILLVSVGAFLGSIFTTVSGAQIVLRLEGSPLYILIVSVQAAVALAAFALLFLGWTRDGHIRNVGDALGGCVIVFFLLFVSYLL